MGVGGGGGGGGVGVGWGGGGGGGGWGGEYIPKQLEVLLLIHNLISVYFRKWNELPGAPFY